MGLKKAHKQLFFRVFLFLLLIKESWQKIEKYLDNYDRTVAYKGTFHLQIIQTGKGSEVIDIEMGERLGPKAGRERSSGNREVPSVLVKWSKMTRHMLV